MPEVESVAPKYLQIAQHLREQVVRGDLLPGDEVPSERQIALDWHVARPTAARALETLRRDGTVESRVGAGTYVRDVRAYRRAAHRYHRFRERGAQYAPGESVEITAAAIVTAPEYVSESLGLPAGARVMMRRRIISTERDGPEEIATSWWPAELAEVAPRLLLRETLGGIGSVRYVESVTGRAALFARDRVGSRLATEDEARDLALSASDPQAVLVYRHTVFDADEAPLEFAEAVYPPGAWSVEQEYPIEA